MSRIEWTDITRNPIRARRLSDGKVGYHCVKVSEGCQHCYAESHNHRELPGGGSGQRYSAAGGKLVEPFLDEDVLRKLLRMREQDGTRVFFCSMTDWCGEWVRPWWRDAMLAVALVRWDMDFQFLTKHPGRLKGYLEGLGENPFRLVQALDALCESAAVLDAARARIAAGGLPAVLSNCLMGFSAENQKRWNERAPVGCEIAGLGWRVFASLEPLLGPIRADRIRVEDSHYIDPLSGTAWDDGNGDLTTGPDGEVPIGRISWVICGGESGRGARAMHPDWVRGVRDQCVDAGVAFFFKQWGAWVPLEHGGETLARRSFDFGSDGLAGAQDDGLLSPGRGVRMVRVGKKRAGALLDGREWREVPGAGKSQIANSK